MAGIFAIIVFYWACNSAPGDIFTGEIFMALTDAIDDFLVILWVNGLGFGFTCLFY